MGTMSTQQKILEASLQLFNDRGISTVSLRDIADEVGISVGNLQYHFKKREDIIEALYFELVGKIDSVFSLKTDDLLQSALNVLVEVFTILYEYHFFLLDFTTITRKNQKIKSHYAELSRRRAEAFLKAVDDLIENGFFREELLKNEYQSLFKRIEVISNFWFSSILIQADVLSESSIKEYSLLISQSIYPYLTDEAKSQYATIFPSQLI
ncbi:MAG: TetR/AcrR family transcriptional regulator [Bacteroidota bacterium]